MLRLEPSELTLTPDDVDETLRRMARRQPPNPSTAPAQRYPRNRWQPSPPRLRPGPQRSAGNAFSDLGKIPVLRPHPQQAVITHVDDDEEPEETLTEPGERDETSLNAAMLPTQSSQFEPASSPATAPPPRHSARLPFRLGRHRGRTNQEVSTLFKDQSDDSDGTLVDLTGPPMETTNVSGPSTPRRRRANTSEDTTPSPSPSLLASRSSTSVALRGGSGQPGKSRMRPTAQDATNAPSPLRQAQMPSPSHHRGASQGESDDEPADTVHLQGYFDFSNRDVEYTYTFREVPPRCPQTEPHRKASYQRFHTRSQSSNDASNSRPSTQSLGASNTPRNDDTFWTTATSNPHLRNDRGTGVRPRLRSSEMSNTSLAYSYYELPEARQSSGEQPGTAALPQPQYDGAATSRQASRGTYRSVRVADAHALTPDGNVSRPLSPHAPSYVPSNSGFVYPPGFSPSPAEPYARRGPTGDRVAAVSYPDLSLSNRQPYPDAAAAVMANHHLSPLDALANQYGWAAQRLAGQQGQAQRNSQVGSQFSAYSNAHLGPGMYGSHPYASNAYGPPVAMPDDPYTRGATAYAGQRPMTSYMARPATNTTVRSNPNNTQASRTNHRSNENATAGPSVQGGHTAPRTQVQDQVSAFEQMHNAAQARHTRQLPEARQRPPRQRSSGISSSPLPPPAIPPRHASRPQPAIHPALSPSQGNSGRRSVRMDPRLQDQENSGQAEAEMMRQELETVRTRYDDDQQREVMDETPPRIGRFERHM